MNPHYCLERAMSLPIKPIRHNRQGGIRTHNVSLVTVLQTACFTICIPTENGTDRDRTCGAWSFSPSLYHLSYRPFTSGNLSYDQVIHLYIPNVRQDDKIIQCWHCLSILPFTDCGGRYPTGILNLFYRHSRSFPYIFYLFSRLIHIDRNHENPP